MRGRADVLRAIGHLLNEAAEDVAEIMLVNVEDPSFQQMKEAEDEAHTAMKQLVERLYLAADSASVVKLMIIPTPEI